ncbi:MULTISPECIES: RNA 2'-phosphotransferase [unclassified Solibacillus]|uniref:RNA 2'-phosphotransferase n=1 Tax=unclassified Solibacillus TaxID=2637870 RepID=UPI0030F87461
MPISTGFYKKIYQWMMNEEKNEAVFRPFISNGNPYKSRVFLVSSNALPLFKVQENKEQLFAEALIDRALFMQLYDDEVMTASREFKGSLQFEQWLLQHNEALIMTSLNAYQLANAEEVKRVKKEDTVNFTRGHKVFHEVLMEFQPEIIILQGKVAFTQFKTVYAEKLTIYNPSITKVPVLEEEGPFAELQYDNGKKAHVFVARSMSYFGKDGTTFERLKRKIMGIL